MMWILGTASEVRAFPDLPSFSRAWSQGSGVYGGFLWSDIHELPSRLETFHSQLLRDFSLGWRVVGMVVRGPSADLGPYAAPTAARAHGRAPLGLYLICGEALTELLDLWTEDGDLSHRIHSELPSLGAVFCDPNLEVELSPEIPRDFRYVPPSRSQVWKSVARALLRGER